MIWFFQHEGQSHRQKFLVELHHGTAPYLLDIYQRHYVPREKLLSFSPDGPSCFSENTVRVTNLVARFYNRTALPTEMVARLQVADFQKEVADILPTQFGEAPLHEQVSVVYGTWEPNDEEGPYRFERDVVVRSPEAVDFVLVAR